VHHIVLRRERLSEVLVFDGIAGIDQPGDVVTGF